MGTRDCWVVPFPNCPDALEPQVHTTPSVVTAIPCPGLDPAAISATFDRLAICVGTSRRVGVPSPTWPLPFSPQAHAVPSLATAAVKYQPAETPIALDRLDAITPLDELFCVLSPS